MTAAGIGKVIEECGELVQICAKKLQYWYTDEHPDGNGSMRLRMQNEMGDVLAAIRNAILDPRLDLDVAAIHERERQKVALFAGWQEQLDNNDLGIDRATPL